jgi:hypothetical protein
VDLREALIHGHRQELMYRGGVIALHEVRSPAVATHQLFELRTGNPREQRRVVDLVSVQVKDRQHGSIAHRVEKLVRVPGGGQGAGLRLAIAHRHGDEQVRVVERGAKGVRQAVAELAALVNGSRRFRRAVAADTAGKGKLLEEAAQAFLVFTRVRVDLGVGALEIDRREYARGAVAGAGQEDGVDVLFANEPVDVQVHQRKPRARTPVAEEATLDVFLAQGLAQQRVVLQINHPCSEVVAGTPVGVEGRHFLPCKGFDARYVISRILAHESSARLFWL